MAGTYVRSHFCEAFSIKGYACGGNYRMNNTEAQGHRSIWKTQACLPNCVAWQSQLRG